MTTKTFVPKASAKEVRTALIMTSGNVTHAAKLLNISKMHIMRLTAKHDLRIFALKLRMATGRSATGAPPRA
jgi:hypothetical protein